MQILRKVPDLLLPSSLRELFQTTTDLLRLIVTGLRSLQTPSGLYEVLSYQATLELRDPQGQSAIYEKRQHVRFLQDCSTGFYDYGWGDGQSFASHRVRPGRIVDRQPLGPRYKSLIALPSPQRKGESFTFTVRRRMEGAFRTPEEWWLDVEVYHRTKQLKLVVVFPQARRARRAWAVAQRKQTTVELAVDRYRGDGRQAVVYQVKQPEVGERYTLCWEW